MTQCRGFTKKGEPCRRTASSGSEFCSVHQDQEVRPRTPRTEWDADSMLKAALGLALVGAIVVFRLRR